MSDPRPTREYYRSAITALEAYVVDEMDDGKVEAAEKKIRQYRLNIIDASFDAIAQRTQRLQELVNDLRQVIDQASGPSVGGAIGGLRDLAGQAAGALGGQGDEE